MTSKERIIQAGTHACASPQFADLHAIDAASLAAACEAYRIAKEQISYKPMAKGCSFMKPCGQSTCRCSQPFTLKPASEVIDQLLADLSDGPQETTTKSISRAPTTDRDREADPRDDQGGDSIRERQLELVARISEYAAHKHAYGGWEPVRDAITALTAACQVGSHGNPSLSDSEPVGTERSAEEKTVDSPQRTRWELDPDAGNLNRPASNEEPTG